MYAYTEWDYRRDVAENNREVVGRYCNSGSTSRAQYNGCLRHVTYDQVRQRYVRGTRGTPHGEYPPDAWKRSAAVYAVECGLTPPDYTPRGIPACGRFDTSPP